MLGGAQYSERVAGGALYLITQQLDRDPQIAEDLEAQFDAQFIFLENSRNSLSDYDNLRLDRGQTLAVVADDGAISLMHRMPGGQVLQVVFRRISNIQIAATVNLLIAEWRYSGETLPVFVDRMQPHFGYPLSVVTDQRSELTPKEQQQLNSGQALLRFSLSGESVEVLAPIAGQNIFLKFGPITAPSPYPWKATLTIATMGVLLMGLAVYSVISRFELRLRRLEQATSRLSRGHLHTRVAIPGQDPVARLGRSFNKMAEHIQRLISIQREMIRAVSHELRTPVARIRFGVQIIEDSVADDAFVAKQVAGMDADIQELDDLIDEILTYARLEEGGPLLDFQQLDLLEIAQQVVDEARPPQHVTVVNRNVIDMQGANSHSQVEAEPRYIHRAMQNLVGNACRYATSRVIVVCQVDDSTCRVDIEDDGAGIPEEDWERVFTAFARLDDSRTRASGGYGLGLSIVRRIAYWHGGQAIVSRSEELGGAKFSLIWPRLQERAPELSLDESSRIG